mmetsp:Transcript_102447/g.306009  ORF Transcript_102447/g.306009 Transcript_102447/m.306009 type:complete len:271 (-) Transcript_102447:18-830(-)
MRGRPVKNDYDPGINFVQGAQAFSYPQHQEATDGVSHKGKGRLGRCTALRMLRERVLEALHRIIHQTINVHGRCLVLPVAVPWPLVDRNINPRRHDGAEVRPLRKAVRGPIEDKDADRRRLRWRWGEVLPYLEGQTVPSWYLLGTLNLRYEVTLKVADALDETLRVHLLRLTLAPVVAALLHKKVQFLRVNTEHAANHLLHFGHASRNLDIDIQLMERLPIDLQAASPGGGAVPVFVAKRVCHFDNSRLGGPLSNCFHLIAALITPRNGH